MTSDEIQQQYGGVENRPREARYRYDPFGNTIGISSGGSLASANVYRFSSKEIHTLSGMYYYGYRWYAPNLQRWSNRDPIGETGFEQLRSAMQLHASGEEPDFGANLYGYALNDPQNKIDPLGSVPPGQGISVPPSIPNSDELKKAVQKYSSACKCGDTPSDVDCHTICDAFYGNIAPTLVANCMLKCGDCELGKFIEKNPPGSKKKTKPKPKK